MLTRIRKSVAGASFGILGIAGLIALGACGDIDRSPLSSSEVAVDQPAGTPPGLAPAPSRHTGMLVFSPRASVFAAAKKADEIREREDGEVLYYGEDSDWFDPKESDKLKVQFVTYVDKKKDEVQVEKVEFRFWKNTMVPPEGAPEEKGKYQITMKVWSGWTLDQVLVQFEPTGTKFEKIPALMTVKLRGNISVAEAREYVVWHVSGNGTVSKVYALVLPDKNGVRFQIVVPGFSDWEWDDIPEGEG
jgi:hypothetical protein